jgi:hypothetical protein
MLKWNPTDALTVLEVEPVVAEHEVSHAYRVAKDGMRLDLTVFQYAGDVHISVFNERVEWPVVECRLVDCDACRRVADKRGEFLEFAGGRLFGGRYDEESVIPYGVRVRVAPSIQVQFFRN